MLRVENYKLIFFMILAILIAAGARSVYAKYGTIADSTLDPSIMRIDEEEHLGARLDGELSLLDKNGDEFKLKDMSGKPLILVFSYYSCDGACPSINVHLRDTLSGISGLKPGEDYNVLTVSFDKNDDLHNLNMFTEMTGIKGGKGDYWRITVMKNKDDIEAFTKSAGYKFFWSPPDRTFLHTNAYIFVSPDLRIARYIYGSPLNSKDVELAVTEAAFNRSRKSRVIDILKMACYSYNYKDGRYTLNYPLFVGVGAFILGAIFIFTPIIYFRKRKEARS